eukprot:4596786-Pleurochrysis_carterae.AAC.1
MCPPRPARPTEHLRGDGCACCERVQSLRLAFGALPGRGGLERQRSHDEQRCRSLARADESRKPAGGGRGGVLA